MAAREQPFREHSQAGAYLQDASGLGETGGVQNVVEGVAVYQEILPERAVRVEAVLDAPRLYLAGTREVHFASSGIG